jgi:Lipase (class 3)
MLSFQKGSFCDGEAHAEMSLMAERLWDVNDEIILDLLRQYPSYELLLVGHSLGGGTASLLHMLCHHNPLLLQYQSRIRCVVFACPPVYTPISSSLLGLEQQNTPNANTKRAMASCINFIHENDCISFLSIDSIRHLCYGLKVIEDMNIRWNQRIQLITQYIKPDLDLISSIQRTNTMRLQPLPGAPILIIPASINVWMKEAEEIEDSDGKLMSQYNVILCDSMKLVKLGIYLDLNMFIDHMPSRYEHALEKLVVTNHC